MKLSEERQKKVEENLGLVHKVINDKVRPISARNLFPRRPVPDWMHRSL